MKNDSIWIEMSQWYMRVFLTIRCSYSDARKSLTYRSMILWSFSCNFTAFTCCFIDMSFLVVSIICSFLFKRTIFSSEDKIFRIQDNGSRNFIWHLRSWSKVWRVIALKIFYSNHLCSMSIFDICFRLKSLFYY